MKCLSSFTQTKEDILKNVGNTVPVDFHSMEKFIMDYYGIQWGPETVWLNILQNILLCVKQKKFIHTGLEQLEE